MNMKNTIKVWDLPLRLFHWILVAAFVIAYITEDDFLTLHVWAGYVIAGLIAFRLIWGFIGGKYARFSNFLCRPSLSIEYLKNSLFNKSKRYIGHNPAGSVMIMFLLLCLLITTVTGFAVYGAEENAGPLASIGMQYEELWEEMHEIFANTTLLLVILHILGVALESFTHKENLVKAMITGNKRNQIDSSEQS
ncbi:MAG: cytochrome b/b6 domain-containing protein [Methylococcaceae bacterium]|nr:cytochrome b/b6 domain-containing protein [Methylococcaceae bacterium]